MYVIVWIQHSFSMYLNALLTQKRLKDILDALKLGPILAERAINHEKASGLLNLASHRTKFLKMHFSINSGHLILLPLNCF